MLVARRRRFYSTKLSYYPNATATFQLMSVLTSGDVASNPGPTVEKKGKCLVCCRTVARNHRAVECCLCKSWCHIKCGSISPQTYKKLINTSALRWTCPACVQPPTQSSNYESPLRETFNFSESFFDEQDEGYVNEDLHMPSKEDWRPEIVKRRSKDSREILLMHPNVNSLQNKKEELERLINQFKAQVIFLTETKIDASYSNGRFAINNLHIYGNDRVKGGGGVMAYFSAA